MDGEHKILLKIAVNKISTNEYRFTFTNESNYELEIMESQLAFSRGYWSLILIDAVTMHRYFESIPFEHWHSKSIIIRPEMSVENTLRVTEEFLDYDPALNDHPHILFWAMRHKEFYSSPNSGVMIIKD